MATKCRGSRPVLHTLQHDLGGRGFGTSRAQWAEDNEVFRMMWPAITETLRLRRFHTKPTVTKQTTSAAIVGWCTNIE
jgi:hypothetical protein